MKNICYIVSGIDKALAFEWIAESLDKKRFNLTFVLLHSSKGGLEDYLISHNISHVRLQYRNKRDFAQATLGTFQFLIKYKIEIVHCHLLDAGLVGLSAAKLAGISQRIYTRHYSTYHHVYFPKGVWYDRLINYLSTKIIAVSKVVEKVLVEKENVNKSKVLVIHHGFPLSDFEKVTPYNIHSLKEKYNLSAKWPVIGVVSRYTEWKGIQFIIPAFTEVLKTHPNAHLVLANAKGSFEKEIKIVLSALPNSSYTEITFENDLFTLFKTFDVFVHIPVDEHSEAFGQVYVESMAAGIPSIFSLSGIANEIVLDKINALTVPFQNTVEIIEKIQFILTNKQIAQNLTLEAKKTVQDNFELKSMITKLESLYA